jgi:hypothetical protein
LIGGVFPFDSRSHRWIDALRSFNVSKVGIYDPLYVGDNFLSEQVRRAKTEKTVNGQKVLSDDPYFNGVQCLVTYLGFGFDPNGLLFRNIVDKEFRINSFIDRNLLYYVSQRFEERAFEFQYGMPIVLLEGVLDVECFANMMEYPFVIGYLTSGIRDTLAAVLSSMTNKFLVIPDNDGPEKRALNETQLQHTIHNFNKYGISPYIGKTKLKDFGDVFMYKSATDVYNLGELLENIILNKI